MQLTKADDLFLLTGSVACLEFIFQEHSYWTVWLGWSLALDYSRWCLSGCPWSFVVAVESNKWDITATHNAKNFTLPMQQE